MIRQNASFRLVVCRPISDPVLPNKERQGYFSSVNDLSSTQAKTADKHRTIAAALAESARKGIQRYEKTSRTRFSK